MKKIIYLTLILTLALTACAGNPTAGTAAASVGLASAQNAETAPEVEYSPEDLNSAPTDAEGSTQIQLNGESITVDGPGAAAAGSSLTITAAGSYQISGTLNDGQIIVDSADPKNVTLILAGAQITSLSSAPIYVANAEKVIITLAAGSENTITDGTNYTNLDESGDPNAAIFSHDDLTINGEGALTVNANFNNGIASKDDLKITGGTLTVNAVNDGIKGKDSVAIKDGSLTINARADGIQATNAEDPEKGYVVIEGGTLNITAGLDGIQAETNLLVSGGTLNIVSGGGSVTSASSGGGFGGGRGMEGNPNQTEDSVKGLKAGTDLTISGGEISISSLDDALHANSTLTINGGNLNLASGDDGIHAESALTINDGTLNITESYEGLESQVITLNDGIVHLNASDDGINATSGKGDSNENYVYINGGYLYMDAAGDGLDSNGNFEMNGGTVIVNGPTDNGNGPLDYMSSFKISGGFLVAVGSAGMAQSPSTDSTQYGVLQIFDAMQAAGTLVHIETAAGKEVLTFVPTKQYQSLVISSPELENGTSYVVYTGGSSSGTPVDGLITDGAYTPGTQAAEFTISSIITGESQGMFPGGGGRPGGGGQHPPKP